MGTMKQLTGKETKRKKLELNKETVKDLTVQDGGARALRGGGSRISRIVTGQEICDKDTQTGL